ncbi:pyridine nucleotide-disulfide oxidoreductase dimerization region [Chondrocystis sp. NIES-4102]|nr:pyridine nucleotide-disulfide oxidoreductase dimerization region [Chondrocystis sp. NIES-4102]
MRDSLEYDLIIIGSSWEGIYAAKVAVQLQARVALVTQCNHGNYLINEALINRSLGEFAAWNYQLVNSPLAAIAENKIPNISISQANNWTININSIIQTQNSLAGLAALGVDVIVGMGEFYRLPKLGLQVNKRKLRSRNFLLATGSVFNPQFLSEDLSNSYLTLKDWDNNKLTQLPDNIIVVGSDPIALEFAQTLTRFGKKITLVVKHSRILPQEDLEIATLIQAQLEAEGINIVTNSEVSQIKIINNQKWLQASDRALSADEIIIADYRQPNIEGLNLAGVEVKYNQQRVYVNQKLQTTNPNIYACGDLIGGYCLPSIAQYEVGLILKNTLFFPWYKTNYYPQPWAILTQPNLARVGLNERQARQKYGEIYILKQYYNQVAQAQISDQTTGLCKLIVLEDGTIIGCSLIGDRAADLITVISLMMQHQIKLDSNPMRGLTSVSIPTIYPTMTEILHHVSNDFYQQKLQRHPNLLKRLQTWFAWRK